MLTLPAIAAVLLASATLARADSEIVIAIRYLQAEGTSHSHLYLYREGGKFLRQLTNDNSGQDVDPIFAPDGGTIVFTREKPKDVREFWGVDPRGKDLKKLDAAPDWYTATNSSPFFTDLPDNERNQALAVGGGRLPIDIIAANAPSPGNSPEPTSLVNSTPSPQESASPSATPENTAELPTYKTPDGSAEIIWHQGKDKEDPMDRTLSVRDLKSGKETELERLPGFFSCEPLHDSQNKDRQFLFDGPLRLAFFNSHLNSTDGDTCTALDFNGPRLERLSENWATPIPLPGEAAFLTFTENRYVEIPGSQKTANCSYMEHWDANLKNLRYARPNTAAICSGASMYRPGHTPATVTIRKNAE